MFDPRIFWGDETVKKMTGEEVAVYLKALSLQWENGSIPDDPEDLAILLTEGRRHYAAADLAGVSKEGSIGTLKAPLKGSLWYALRDCFEVPEGRPGRLENPRQARGREAWIAKQSKASDDGKKGVRVKRDKARRKQRNPKGTLKGPFQVSVTDPQAVPIPSPVPVPVPSPSPEKRKSAAHSRVSFVMPPKLGIGKAEAAILDTLIKDPEKIDVDGVRASHVTDEATMRVERLHLLAELVVVSEGFVDADTSLQLWCAWRVKARAKARPRLPESSPNDWRNEVETLRMLRQRPDERRHAIGQGELNGWRGFEWDWVKCPEPKGGYCWRTGSTG